MKARDLADCVLLCLFGKRKEFAVGMDGQSVNGPFFLPHLYYVISSP